MDDEPRVRRQRAGLLVGCATLPMSEPHRHPHGRLRKLKNRLKTSRSAREPHRAATSLAMARPARALQHHEGHQDGRGRGRPRGRLQLFDRRNLVAQAAETYPDGH